jgi:Glycosyl hydrolase 108
LRFRRLIPINPSPKFLYPGNGHPETFTAMTPRFNKFLPFILSHETEFKSGHYGDYNFAVAEDDPDDPGGTTKFGVDYGEHKNRPFNMTEDHIRNLTLEGARHIYWQHWCLDKIELLPSLIGECYFNCATMSGVPQANLILNRTHTAEEYIKDYLNVFDKIIARRPAAAKYRKGWRARLLDLSKFLNLPNI